MKWKFKKDAEPQGSSDGFWYDITLGGYIEPKDLLEDEDQIKQLNKAIELVQSFEDAMDAKGLLNEF